ncbi:MULTISPECIES: hypothetical protein [Legionella]|uniref:Uncharacterized protein n=1 Tax=Legionella maceachernii TaxID=466 RepID=A0A0W0VYU0_9GAMM|nr:hypothetical protein [Legionella maceachernii]KTD24870.1 hypothetical protein Lmac_2407 [Legionella maceachernii]SKA15688.1 hypothetical protein SAMN02745128_02314 [Legionella maceachernii]SUP01540.1 Uncharacterised protein [Legionella maceachernii]
MKRKDHSDSKSNDIAESYNKFKEFEGRQYTGMKVGRSHHWIYDPGEWKETKLTPDKWTISYAVTKRRKGKAPEGSGVPVGTKYHWYIFAHQIVQKLNANDYSTEMVGLKYKVAHRRASQDDWNISDLAQKKRLLKILQELVTNLEEEIDASKTKKPKKDSLAVKAKKSKTTAAIKHFPHKKDTAAKNEPFHEESPPKKGRHR